MPRLLSYSFLPVILGCDVRSSHRSATVLDHHLCCHLRAQWHKPSQLPIVSAAWLRPVPECFSSILTLKCEHTKAGKGHSQREPTGSSSPNWPFKRTERLTLEKALFLRCQHLPGSKTVQHKAKTMSSLLLVQVVIKFWQSIHKIALKFIVPQCFLSFTLWSVTATPC